MNNTTIHVNRKISFMIQAFLITLTTVMRQQSIYFIILLGLLCVQCQNEQRQLTPVESLDSFKQIEGLWQLQPNLETFERWETTNNGLIGRGYTVSGSDTTINEVYFFELIGDSIRLEVQPITDNGISAPINYTLSSATPNQYIFENPNHNFPNKMTYKFKKEEVSIYLEGDIGGLHQEADLLMKKINP